MDTLTVLGSLVGSSIISVLTSFLLMRRYSSALRLVLESKIEEFKDAFESLNVELEKVKPTISKAYGLLSSENITPIKVKTAEKYIAEDVMESYPEAKALVRAISPRTAEYLEENPEALIQIITRWGPKLLALSGHESLSELIGNKGGYIGQPGKRSKEWAWSHR